MRYSWKDIPAILQTPIGPSKFKSTIWRKSWPLLSRLAILYRHTLIRNTRVVAVLGSFGKTTTARAVAAALGARVRPRFGPNSAAARAVLHIRPHDRHSVIDVGIDSPGQMAVFARVIQPDITVVTSIGSEHNRSLGILEVTRAEKSEMVKILPTSGIAVLNGDDPNVLWMRGQTRARIITFGIDKTNDVRASDITLDWPNGTRFKIHADGEIRELRIRLMGRHMVYPILAAVAASLAEGSTLDQITPGLEALPPTPGRLEPIRLEKGAIILRDDFKSSLETIDAALDVFSEIPAKRHIVVLGEVSEPPGSQGPIYRKIGERFAKIASYAIFVGVNYQRYAAGASRAGLSRDALINAGENVLKPVEILRRDLKTGDVVLIKGRDTQKLERVAFSLMGRKVSCDINFCDLKLRCASCPMLERGWRRLKVMG
ncbi:MAG: Mur ligase family protein [Thermodesulfobacteriota bacterium]